MGDIGLIVPPRDVAATADAIRRIAERYDAAATDRATTCVDPQSGRDIGAMWLIPRSAEGLYSDVTLYETVAQSLRTQ